MAVQYITDNNALAELSESLKNVPEFAIDLEFDRNHYRYGFNMCLMQIYDGNECYLIDPLSNNLDIETIFPPIEDPNVQKVAFAFGEDLRLFHSLGCFPKNLYDLDIITSLLNFEPASLTNLIKEVLDVEVNSSSQQSNWFRRPLTHQQKDYAADDVLYLLDFKKSLDRQAEEHGISHWVAQENAIFDQLDYSNEDHNNLIKDKDKNDLTMFQWYVYCRLMGFFDEVAQSYNKPVYHLVRKQHLAELAMNPKAIHRWQSMKGIFGQLKNKDFQTQLKEALDKAIQEAEERELSKTRKARDTMSREEYQAMRNKQNHINNLKNQLFNPIQDKIASQFGKHAKSFILPNRLTKEILSGEADRIPEYKVELFQRVADELNLDLSEYL
jgi:ribonuclease D